MNNKKARLIEGPVGKILVEMTIPMVFGILGVLAFNLVDTFFVSKLGTNELAALSYTFPVVMVIGSMTLGLGAGAAAVISRAIGEGSHHKVQQLTTYSLILSLLLGAILVLAGFFTLNNIFSMLGATKEIMVLIKQYMVIWYAGVMFVVIPMVGNNAIRATGDMKTPSIIMLISVVLNMVLDPLLIFGLGPFPRLGIQGAAIATVIARIVTLIFSLYILIYRDDMLTFNVRPIRNLISSCKSILYVGVPTAVTRMVMPVAAGVLTRIISKYGNESVAAFGVGSRIEFFALTVVFALATVLGPFVGQNWGAGKKDRVASGINMSKKFSMKWGAVMLILLAIAAKYIAPIFSDNPKVVSTIVLYLRIIPISYGLFGILVITATTLTVLHRPLQASALVIFQMFVLCVPLAFLGSHFFGIPGIFYAIAIAYIISGIIANAHLVRVLAREDEVPAGKF